MRWRKEQRINQDENQELEYRDPGNVTQKRMPEYAARLH
jgi:hypothetical protein